MSACSKEEDKTACCFGSCVNDVKPRAFDRGDVYQQVEVQRLPSSGNKGFKDVAVATDGIPPHYLRKKGWKVNSMMSPRYHLASDAQGVNSVLCRQMPDLESLSITDTYELACRRRRQMVRPVHVRQGRRGLQGAAPPQGPV